jgi:hypothetical protein
MEEHVANELTPSLETVLFRNALTQNGIIASEGLSNEIEFGALCRFNLTEILNSKVGIETLYCIVCTHYFLLIT